MTLPIVIQNLLKTAKTAHFIFPEFCLLDQNIYPKSQGNTKKYNFYSIWNVFRSF